MKYHFQKIKNLYHLFQAVIANIYYGFPCRKIKVIGVTGTDGKTTTTHLIYHILMSAGKKVSMISTVYAKVGSQVHETGLHTTTPNPFLVQRLLKQAVEQGDEYFVLEVTSHALDQNRVWGVDYEISTITNVTHEHLDYHPNYKHYVATKALILDRSKIGIVNIDDESYEHLSQKVKILSYGLNKKADFSERFDLHLTEFNKYNYLGAFAVCTTLGISKKNCIDAMKSFELPPGRLDIIYKDNFTVMIDFAHTPNAIEQLLKSLKPDIKGRVIHVFGSAGLRDVSKRPLMGEASGRYSDIVILTEEDYRTENVNVICHSIAQGLEKVGLKSYSIITDRQKAIDKAITTAQKGDWVIITGKGHEKSLCRGKIEYPWSDEKTVEISLKQLKSV